MTTKERYKGVYEWFSENVKNPKSELSFRNPYELLIAVMLSAQCTDKRVNMVTPLLFEKYPTVEELARADENDLLEIIRSISYPNAKTRHLIGAARKIVSDYNSTIPEERESLETLPGVGRKTAGVILSVAFGKQEIPVDTHVFRVSERIGLTTNSKNPTETEMKLRHGFPKECLADAHHWLILHGRYICTAHKPKCSKCEIKNYCRHYKKYTEKL